MADARATKGASIYRDEPPPPSDDDASKGSEDGDRAPVGDSEEEESTDDGAGGGSSSESSDGSGDGSGDGKASQAMARAIREASKADEAMADDATTADIVTGAIGFAIALVIAGALPSLGVDHTHVMVGGMLAILSIIVWINFFQKATKPGEERSYAGPIFLFASGLGCMIGGMFGNVLKHYFRIKTGTPLWAGV